MDIVALWGWGESAAEAAAREAAARAVAARGAAARASRYQGCYRRPWSCSHSYLLKGLGLGLDMGLG